MSKDYKHRLQQAQKKNEKPPVAGWQWLLAGVLVLGFVVFLLYLRSKSAAEPPPPQTSATTQPVQAESKKAAPPVAAAPAATPAPKEAPPKEEPPPKLAKPRFQFYTVLPEKEVIIPEAEVKARKQEEKQGKAPVAGDVYMLQIGSFKTNPEADRLKAQLAMLGVEAKIEVAQIGTATWHRVKVGPFASIANADKTRSLLRQSNMDSVVQKLATQAPALVPQQTTPPAPPP